MLTYNDQVLYCFSKESFLSHNKNDEYYIYSIFSSWNFKLDNTFDPWGHYKLIENNFNLDDYNNRFVKQVDKDSKLFFFESSNFPRVKLKQISCKRCNNISNANYAVVHEHEKLYSFDDEIIIFKVKGLQYLIYKKDFIEIFHEDFNLISDLLKITVFDDPIKVIFCGLMYAITNNSDFPHIVDSDIKLICDYDLDQQINKSLPSITEEELFIIQDMLLSNDYSNKKLAAKMICAYNPQDFPLTFKTLIFSNGQFFRYEKFVLLNQFLDTLNIKEISWSYISNLVKLLSLDIDNCSQNDIEYCKKIISRDKKLYDNLKFRLEKTKVKNNGFKRLLDV